VNTKRIIIAVVAIVALALAGYQLKSNRDRNTQQKEALTTDRVTVSIAPVTRMRAAMSLELVGSTYAWREVDVAAETAGRIDALAVKLGQRVAAGAVLAVIDGRSRQLAVQSARITAEKLQKDFARVQNLYAGGTSSEQELDNARSAYETAKTNLELAQKQYADTKIVAPFGGVVTDKAIEQGSYVTQGMKVVSLVDVSRLKVKTSVSEANVYALQTGRQVAITSDALPDAAFSGTITFISPRGDAAHNYPVEIEMRNDAGRQLRPGTFVTVRVADEGRREGLFIPREALQGSVKEAKVYVARNGRAELRDVVIGRRSIGALEVASGLTENDSVIVSGQVNLTNGRSITVIANN
jgi:RND family efflux transporter MFP subunit